MGQTIRVTNGLVCDNTPSVMITFYSEICDVPQKEKIYSISYLQINNFNSERFLKTNESATINTPEDFVDTATTIYNTKVVSVDQKALSATYICPDCSNEVISDHEYLVDCTCGLMSAKDSYIVNDKVMVSVKKMKNRSK